MLRTAGRPTPSALELVNDVAARLPLQLGPDGRLTVGPADDPLDGQVVVAIVLGAMLDGTWSRLKACRAGRSIDYSPNRSATWCSMQLCGNRKKTRAYRSRRRLPVRVA